MLKFNQKLHDELLAMEKHDQQTLKELVDNGGLAIVEYHPKMKAVHQKNSARVKQILDQHGWPGFNLVGKQGSKACWLLVQHAVLDTELMESALPLLKEAINQEQAEPWCFAYLQDRVLTMYGKLQIYGTQHHTDEKGIVKPLPIKEPEKVEELRKELELEPLSKVTKLLQERHNETIKNREKNTM